MLHSMGSQRVRHHLVTGQQQHGRFKCYKMCITNLDSSENLKQLSKLSYCTLYGLLESVECYCRTFKILRFSEVLNILRVSCNPCLGAPWLAARLPW